MDKTANTTRHSDDLQDIISTPPNALLRWGITWVLIVLSGIVALGAFIRYPDIVQAPVRITTANAPKAIISRISGNLVKILVDENSMAAQGQPLAWMESTADHQQVIDLLSQLHALSERHFDERYESLEAVIAPHNLRLGELQGGYQAFYQSYLNYKAATKNGIYLKRRAYILLEIQQVESQRLQLEKQRRLQQQEYELAEEEFKRYNELAKRKIISPSEFQQQQAILLAKQHPLQQTQSSLIANEASQTTKIRELADLDNQINEERSKFIQALNSLLSEAEQWRSLYVLTASQGGRVIYAGIIQQNQHVDTGQEVFFINPESTDFFGELNVPQYNMGKVKTGQEVLIKLNSYPFEEYGVLKGAVGQLNRVPFRDSIFLARIDFRYAALPETIQLTTGMTGTAEIVTEDASLLQRLARNVKLVLNNRN